MDRLHRWGVRTQESGEEGLRRLLWVRNPRADFLPIKFAPTAIAAFGFEEQFEGACDPRQRHIDGKAAHGRGGIFRKQRRDVRSGNSILARPLLFPNACPKTVDWFPVAPKDPSLNPKRSCRLASRHSEPAMEGRINNLDEVGAGLFRVILCRVIRRSGRNLHDPRATRSQPAGTPGGVWLVTFPLRPPAYRPISSPRFAGI